MDERGEVLLEIGPPGTGALPCSLLVSMKPGASGSWDMEIAVDTSRPVESVLVSPDGAPCSVHPLSPTQTGQGLIHYATISVALAGPGIILEILAPDQSAVEDLSTYVRPDRQRSFPLTRLPPGPEAGAASWGPPGAQRWDNAVNLVGAWKSELGLVLDFLVDDSGATSRMGATARPANQAQQAWLAPQAMGPINPSLARVWLPAGTTEVDVSFHGGNGDQIETYRNTISLANMPAVDPLSANLAAPRPTPRMSSLLQGAGRYHAAGSGMHEAPDAPPSFPARPVLAPHASAGPGPRDATDAGAGPELGMQSLARLQAPPPSGGGTGSPKVPISRSGQTKAPMGPNSGPGNAPRSHSGMTAIRDLQHLRRRTGKFKLPAIWPETVGADSPNLGPVGPLTGRAVLSLISAERTAENTRLEFYLDDHGLVASLAIGSAGELVSETSMARITTFSPTRVRIDVASYYEEIIVLGRNAYGEVYQNMAAMVDVANVTFREVSLDRESWESSIQFAAPLALDSTLCCACRRELPMTEVFPIGSLSPAERNQLRGEYALTPDARGLCKPCHEDILLSRQWLHILASAFSGPNLRLGLQRLIFAYAGALLVLTPVGLSLARVAIAAFSPQIEERGAYALSAGILSFLVAVLPWPSLLGAMSAGWRTLLRTGRVTGSATFGVPAVLGLVGLAAHSSSMQLPEAFARSFWRMDLHVAVGVAFLITLVVVILTQRIADMVYEQRLAGQRRMVQMGHTARLIPRLLNVGDMLEFDRTIDRVLMEGLGALEFQVFAMNPDARKFRLKRAVGPLRHQVTGLDFRAGDPHVLGVCAQLGRPLTQAEILADKTLDPAATRSPIPSLAVVPIWVRGEVAEIYNISRFRGIGLGGELPGLMGTLTVVAGRGLTDMLRNAEKAEQDARDAAAGKGDPRSTRH